MLDCVKKNGRFRRLVPVFLNLFRSDGSMFCRIILMIELFPLASMYYAVMVGHSEYVFGDTLYGFPSGC